MPTPAHSEALNVSTQKNPTVHLIPFSHLDLFWLGSREECLSRGNFIIAKALELLERHPDFTFLIETVNFLHNYIECYPQEQERIRGLVQAGRLELSPLWSAIYQNLPQGETLVRNTLYAKRYVRRVFDNDPQTAHFADLPGYTPQYPQIATQSGINQVLMSRGGPADKPLFRWKGIDGTRIDAYYVFYGYALFSLENAWHKDWSEMTLEHAGNMLRTVSDGQPFPSLIHWGCDLFAPTENLIQNVRLWNRRQDKAAAEATDVSPKLEFSTFARFFDQARESSAQGKPMPELEGELPSAWPNIESSWPDIWPEDIACENALYMAEFLATWCHLKGWCAPASPYPTDALQEAWVALLDAMDHNQNSQGGQAGDSDKLQLKRYSRYAAERIVDKMGWRIASRIPSASHEHFPIVVFNTHGWQRSGIVHARATLYGEACSSDVEAFVQKGIRLVDDHGNTVPYVQIDRIEGMSLTLEIAFLASRVPAAGYRTWYLTSGENPINTQPAATVIRDEEAETASEHKLIVSFDRDVQLGPRRSVGCDVISNRFFRLSIDRITGEIDVWSKDADGRETALLKGMSLLAVEERKGNYIFNMTQSGRTFAAQIDTVDILDNNALWLRLRICGNLYGNPFTQTLTLPCELPQIHLHNEIDWQKPAWVRLQQRFPWAGEGNEIRYGVPCGQVTYPGSMPTSLNHGHDEIDPAERDKLRLCQHWVDIGDTENGLSIGADHRMWEFDPTASELRAYMMRGVGYCFGVHRDSNGTMHNIARPLAGKYSFNYVLRPRSSSLEESASWRAGWELNRPLHPVAVGGNNAAEAHFPASDSLFDFTDSSLVVSALKKAEDSDAVILRSFETMGQVPQLPPPVLCGAVAKETDALEQARHAPSPWRPFAIKTHVFDLLGNAPPKDA